MKTNKLVLLGIAVLLVPLVLAIFPGIPHQFYGSVILNGVSPNSGTVTAKINNQTVGSTIITSGKYGYHPIFFIEDKDYNKNGKLIIFYVNGFQAGQYIFENGASTKLNLIVGNYTNFCGDSILGEGEGCDNGTLNGVLCDNSKEDCTYCSSSCKVIILKKESENEKSTHTVRELSLSTTCDPDWQCTNWGECIDETITRICEDHNQCGTSSDKPSESKACALPNAKIELEQKQTGVSLWILLVLSILIIGALTLIFNRMFRK
jgi:hypothetical protein